MLTKQFGIRDCGVFLDLAAYSIVCENNVGQCYPDYAYNHPLLTEKMHVYRDSYFHYKMATAAIENGADKMVRNKQ